MQVEVFGVVQGVGFRMHVLRAARRIGICGFVMNRDDGSVYLEATGSSEQLAELENHCRAGAPLSKVHSVTVRKSPATTTYTTFEVRY